MDIFLRTFPADSPPYGCLSREFLPLQDIFPLVKLRANDRCDVSFIPLAYFAFCNCHNVLVSEHGLCNTAVEDEFKEFDQSDPNCVVLGDATMAFTYPRLNEAFHLLIQQPGTQLITMGVGYSPFLMFRNIMCSSHSLCLCICIMCKKCTYFLTNYKHTIFYLFSFRC